MGTNSAIAMAALFLAFAASSCSSSITSGEAEGIAVSFVQERVKFFARSENETIDIPAYSFDSISTTERGNSYVVDLHVSAVLGNDTKEADLSLTVNSQGEVINMERIP